MWQKPFESTLAKSHIAPRLRELNMTLVAAVGFPRPLNTVRSVLPLKLARK